MIILNERGGGGDGGSGSERRAFQPNRTINLNLCYWSYRVSERKSFISFHFSLSLFVCAFFLLV